MSVNGWEYFLNVNWWVQIFEKETNTLEREFIPEIIWRSHQAGIAETVDYVVKLYDAETQQQLVKNIFVTGGCANLPGFVIFLLYSSMFFFYIYNSKIIDSE